MSGSLNKPQIYNTMDRFRSVCDKEKSLISTNIMKTEYVCMRLNVLIITNVVNGRIVHIGFANFTSVKVSVDSCHT